jgi:penicillin-binding protein 1A
MGIFSRRKRKSRDRRVEPRLFDDRSRKAARKSAPTRPRSIARRLIRFGFTLSIWGLIGLTGLFTYIWFSLDQKGLLKIPDREPGIMILAADGTAIAEQGAFFGDDVMLSELPDYVPNAVIAIEDRRFYSHYGVDPIGLLRAVFANLRSGHTVQGGSTLTQQLAKNLFLTADRTYQRKLQEMVLAVWLEAKFTKQEILQLYLNRVYYGAGAVGIEKAAQTYYHKSARELTISEAAALAGLLKAPATYSPLQHPAESAARAELVINAMVETGAISAREGRRAIEDPARTVASNYVPATRYIADWVNGQLPDLVKDYQQSIVVETTIDPALQRFAERDLRKHLEEEGAKLSVSEGALVVMDVGGAVKAMVGGRSYKRSQFNRATKAQRQPGSAFKPFLYLAAMERGFTPESVEVDEPVRIGNWVPENYNQRYMGPVTLRKALALSLNSVAAKLVSAVGPEAVADTAHRLGILSSLGTDASIALGTSEVNLLELTSAFAPFANGGRPVVPFVITRITTRDGAVLYQRQGEGFDRVVSSEALGEMNDMMRAVVTEGTARRAQFGNFDLAGKTGTSQDYRDAWFIGYSAQLVGGVWVGNDDNSPTRKVTGGSIPAAIWHDVMEEAHAGLTPLPLPGGSPGDGMKETIVSQLPEQVAPSQQDYSSADDGGFLAELGKIFGSSGRSAGDGRPSRRHPAEQFHEHK